MTKIIVTGGAGYSNQSKICTALDALHFSSKISRVIIGDASKVEKIADNWARATGIQTATFLLDFSIPRKEAVAMRNRLMLDHGADMVLAFPGGDSAADMCKQAEAAGVRVLRVER